jgi:hypothetical protein
VAVGRGNQDRTVSVRAWPGVALSFYGSSGEDPPVIAPAATPGGPSRVIEYKSVLVDLPILEYRPYRSSSSNQSSSALFQLFTAVDVPYSASVVSPAGAPNNELRNVFSMGLRLVFDWRHYP